MKKAFILLLLIYLTSLFATKDVELRTEEAIQKDSNIAELKNEPESEMIENTSKENNQSEVKDGITNNTLAFWLGIIALAQASLTIFFSFKNSKKIEYVKSKLAQRNSFETILFEKTFLNFLELTDKIHRLTREVLNLYRNDQEILDGLDSDFYQDRKALIQPLLDDLIFFSNAHRILYDIDFVKKLLVFRSRIKREIDEWDDSWEKEFYSTIYHEDKMLCEEEEKKFYKVWYLTNRKNERKKISKLSHQCIKMMRIKIEMWNSSQKSKNT
jgi:hypothetical protein